MSNWLNDYRAHYGMVDYIECSDEENAEYQKLENRMRPLPDGVEKLAKGEYGKARVANMTDSERLEFLMYKQLEMINVVKGCAIFFVVMSVIGVLMGVLIPLLAK